MRGSSRLARLALAGLLGVLVLLSPRAALALDSEPLIANERAAVVMDGQGKVLFDYNGSEEMPMASITKVMTAMVALDSGIPLDTPIDFIEQEFNEGAQLGGYKSGDTPTFGELLMVTLVYSGNDAAANVAYAVGGSKEGFADLMNAKAAEIGLEHTHFMNSHGLEEDGHYSSALDLCIMGRYAMEHYPFIRTAVSTPSIDIVADGKPVTLESTDKLMGHYEGLLGIKTGNTESGTSFLGCARRNHATLYSCILCSNTVDRRFEDTVSVLDWGFGLYDQRVLARAAWDVRDVAWQDGFWLRSVVSPQRDAVGAVFCEGDFSYTSVMTKPNAPAAAGRAYGSTIWQQEGRHVESVMYQTRAEHGTLALNPLVRPAFEDIEA